MSGIVVHSQLKSWPCFIVCACALYVLSLSACLWTASNNSGLGGQNENWFLKFGCLISNTHVEMYFFLLRGGFKKFAEKSRHILIL